MTVRLVVFAVMVGTMALSSAVALASHATSAHEDATIMTIVGAGDNNTPREARATQTDEEVASSDTRVPVQLWTLLAAGGAAALGLLLFLVRVATGRVRPPPEQESHH